MRLWVIPPWKMKNEDFPFEKFLQKWWSQKIFLIAINKLKYHLSFRFFRKSFSYPVAKMQGFMLPNGFKYLAKWAWNWLDNLHAKKNNSISFLHTSISSFLDFVKSFSLEMGSVNSRKIYDQKQYLAFHGITFHFSSI